MAKEHDPHGVFDRRNARREERAQQRKQERSAMASDRKAAEQSYRINNPGKLPPRPWWERINWRAINWKGWLALAIMLTLFVGGVLYIRSW